MREDIMRQIEHITTQNEDEQRRMVLEAYISTVCNSIRHEASCAMFNGTTDIPPMVRDFLFEWAKQNRSFVAIQISEVARSILQKELLEG